MSASPLSPWFLPDFIQARLDWHDAGHPVPVNYADYSEWHASNLAFAKALLDELARDRGARFRIGAGDTSRMKLDGISISCTSGPLQMLRGWVRKARARATEGARR